MDGQLYRRVRHAAVAGQFYPEAPDDLRSDLMKYLKTPAKIPNRHVIGLVSPHAGYMYSAPVAGYGYKQLEGEVYETVIVIAPSHFVSIPFASVLAEGCYETPLGIVPTDDELIAKIISIGDESVRAGWEGHFNIDAEGGEHALEVQLPFLQVTLGTFKLVAIIMGDQSWGAVQSLARAVTEFSDFHRTLLVASSDLSHYHPYYDARNKDKQFIERFSARDAEGIVTGCRKGQLEACGGGPIAVLLRVGDLLGGKKVEVLDYATSGDVPGAWKHRVVGYMSAMMYEDKNE